MADLAVFPLNNMIDADWEEATGYAVPVLRDDLLFNSALFRQFDGGVGLDPRHWPPLVSGASGRERGSREAAPPLGSEKTLEEGQGHALVLRVRARRLRHLMLLCRARWAPSAATGLGANPANPQGAGHR